MFIVPVPGHCFLLLVCKCIECVCDVILLFTFENKLNERKTISVYQFSTLGLNIVCLKDIGNHMKKASLPNS